MPSASAVRPAGVRIVDASTGGRRPLVVRRTGRLRSSSLGSSREELEVPVPDRGSTSRGLFMPESEVGGGGFGGVFVPPERLLPVSKGMSKDDVALVDKRVIELSPEVTSSFGNENDGKFFDLFAQDSFVVESGNRYDVFSYGGKRDLLPHGLMQEYVQKNSSVMARHPITREPLIKMSTFESIKRADSMTLHKVYDWVLSEPASAPVAKLERREDLPPAVVVPVVELGPREELVAGVSIYLRSGRLASNPAVLNRAFNLFESITDEDRGAVDTQRALRLYVAVKRFEYNYNTRISSCRNVACLTAFSTLVPGWIITGIMSASVGGVLAPVVGASTTLGVGSITACVVGRRTYTGERAGRETWLFRAAERAGVPEERLRGYLTGRGFEFSDT